MRSRASVCASLSGLIAIVIVCGACTRHDTSSPVTPSQVDVNGTWVGTVRGTGASGGECVGPTLATYGFGDEFDISITLHQNGSSVRGEGFDQGSVTMCSYSGTIVGNALTLTSPCDS